MCFPIFETIRLKHHNSVSVGEPVDTPADGMKKIDEELEKANAKHALEMKQAQVRLPGDGRVEQVMTMIH